MKTSQLLQLQINELNRFAQAATDLAANAPEGIDAGTFHTAARQATARRFELEAQKAEAVAAEEVARQAAKKRLSVRTRPWDASSTVVVTLIPTSYSDTSWEVYSDDKKVGTVSKYGTDSWTANLVGGRTAGYGTLESRADAIRALLPR